VTRAIEILIAGDIVSGTEGYADNARSCVSVSACSLRAAKRWF
jgi:hypothetical protein